MNNFIFDINKIVYVPTVDMYGKVIDVSVNDNNNTAYTIVFDNGTWNTFLGCQIQGDE